MKLSKALEIYKERFGEDGRETHTLDNNRKDALRAVLEAAGVELAPEPEPLPEWWDERLEVSEGAAGNIIKRPNGDCVELQRGSPCTDANRAALALSHSLRVAAAEMVEAQTNEAGDSVIHPCVLVRRLRKILLDNELPEAGGEW